MPLLFVAIAWPALRENSAMYDETSYVPAGFTYLTRGDFRLNPEHRTAQFYLKMAQAAAAEASGKAPR